MAGSILGADQIAKVNAAYPVITAHIRTLLKADASAYGIMKVHFLTDFLDTTELAAIFKDLPFLAPAEKRALVRAAIFDVMLLGPAIMDKYDLEIMESRSVRNVPTNSVPQSFTPPQFKLNVNSTANFHGVPPADVNVAKPVVTSTHTSKVAEDVSSANESMKADQARRDAAVAKLREQTAPKPIEILPAPDTTTAIPQDPE